MNGEAIAGRAIGDSGARMLTTDFGTTRLAGILRAGRDGPAAAAAREGAARATRP